MGGAYLSWWDTRTLYCLSLLLNQMTRWSYGWKTTNCYPHQWTVSTVPTQCRGQRTANLEMATIGDASTGNALRRKEPPQRFEKAAFSKIPGCLSRCTSMCSTYDQPMILRRTFKTSQRSAFPHWSTCSSSSVKFAVNFSKLIQLIQPDHSKCLPQWFHNTFWRMESLPEDTEWTWVWTSHGQSLKAFCSTWRDTYTEHRVLLEPHQATDKKNEWLPQRL